MEETTRGAQKLMGALRAFKIDLRGKTVLDIGSSTGGFTEVAFLYGAAKVVAVEKGTRQMRRALAADPRVELHEKTDIFEFVPEEKPDVIVADVSFLSLTKVLAYAKMELIGRHTVLVVMLKPQFEVGDKDLVNGVIKNSRVQREVVKKFEEWLKRNGFVILGKRDNEVRGRYGNTERFYYLRIHSSETLPNKFSRID